MTATQVAEAYIRATNESDPETFRQLFAEDAVVEDAGRTLRGRQAIAEWSDSDIFQAAVRLEVVGTSERDGEIVLTTKVDGNFDRTGLPDPLLIDHPLRVADGKIERLACRLAGEPVAA